MKTLFTGKKLTHLLKITNHGYNQRKTFINRKIKKLQCEVSELNKYGNIYNNLINIPEIPDLEKIKIHFMRTVTAEQCKAALDRLDKWVAKEKA